VLIVVQCESVVTRALVAADRVLTDVLTSAVVRRTLVLVYTTTTTTTTTQRTLQSRHHLHLFIKNTISKLEYLAVYGRASMGDYYGCVFRVLAVFCQLSTHGQKFDPESLYKPI